MVTFETMVMIEVKRFYVCKKIEIQKYICTNIFAFEIYIYIYIYIYVTI